ncbi:MAG TPA: DUF952 domain-containing protein [Elusimicrobiota bacterium]|jgi:uncharacterized protein (DUF952 family)|nr:DUF952 domain-containing protein [Elusimicrobiota bacterium]
MPPVYKLLRAAEWAAARGREAFEGAPVDLADGFVHFSTAAQVRETAARYFAGEAGLVLAEIDPARLPKPLAWEPSRGGELFPHLYAALPLAAITRVWTLAVGPDGRHEFPPEL